MECSLIWWERASAEYFLTNTMRARRKNTMPLFLLIPVLKKMFVSADFHVNRVAPALLNGVSAQIECFAELELSFWITYLSIKIHCDHFSSLFSLYHLNKNTYNLIILQTNSVYKVVLESCQTWHRNLIKKKMNSKLQFFTYLKINKVGYQLNWYSSHNIYKRRYFFCQQVTFWRVFQKLADTSNLRLFLRQ